MTEPITGFLLSRQWDDRRQYSPQSGRPNERKPGRQKSLHLSFWLQTVDGPVRVIVADQQAVMFVGAEDIERVRDLLTNSFGLSVKTRALLPSWQDKPLKLLDFEQRPQYGLYFREQRSLYRARDLLTRAGIELLEADIGPTDRFLMERFITAAVTVEGDVIERDGFRELINPVIKADTTLPAYQPQYRVMSLDIETSMTGDHLYSIGWVVTCTDTDEHQRCVLMIGPEEKDSEGNASEENAFEDTAPAWDYLEYCADELALMQRFIERFEQIDPDVIIGWNVINFDLRFLQRKAEALEIALPLGRARARPDWRESRGEDEHYTLLIPGRLVLDGIDTLKSATYNFESFSLDSVANELLQRGKLTDDVDNRGEHITEQFLHDKASLAAYNLEDCQLVWDIFQHTQLIDFAIERARLTGLAMDRFGGSVASFDNRYLPRLHRAGYVAPNIPSDPIGVGSPGGYVMDSIPGLYEHVLVLDFKSLYPSIIRTFKIDPYARMMGQQIEPHSPHWDREETDEVDRSLLVPGFNGAVYSKQHNLLPAIIDELWAARDQAKQQNNAAMSQAIKILMNSFYGVLGTPGCRFFDYRLPSSITLRGHDILTRTTELIEDKGYQVIYGDTDSVFVWLKDLAPDASLSDVDDIGRQLADYLNVWWQETLQADYQIESHLEIEFETHFSQFVMPTIRGSDKGSKKRYAGVVRKAGGDGSESDLVFKGLETVRTDWTHVARDFQRELYRRVFAGEAYRDYILQLVKDIRDGLYDDKLYYRKRIRRPLADYTRNVPPHVQAARLADQQNQEQEKPLRYQRGGWIEYLLTINGPEAREYCQSSLDYDLYIERQIEPIADGILHFLDTSFREVAGDQMGLF